MSAEAISDTPAGDVSARKPSRAKSDPNVKRQRLNPLDGDENGIRVAFNSKDAYFVRFAYNAALVSEMHKIPGVVFDKNADAWRVPVSQYETLAVAVGKMRNEFVIDKVARGEIESLAVASTVDRQEANGHMGVVPRLSDFRPMGEVLTGEIISLNSRYAAQLTGFGSKDGAGFVSLHRLSDLEEQIFKGDRVSILYGEKGRAGVKQTQSVLEKLDQSLGKSVDGVTVTQVGEKYQVAFDYNPALSDRIRRVDGVSFDDDKKVYVVGKNLKEFVARAVNDMRKEVIADKSDREQMVTIAAEKIDGANVRDAFVADGKASTGTVLASNDRYVLQHTGKDFVALHKVRNLNEVPEIGRVARISYSEGRGEVNQKGQERSQGVSR